MVAEDTVATTRKLITTNFQTQLSLQFSILNLILILVTKIIENNKMVKGRKRPGAEWPEGGNNETTKLIHVPCPHVEEIFSFLEKHANYKAPLYSSKVRAGFPSPGDDYVETYLDLNQRYIQTPAATFFVIASGDSMVNAHIEEGDMLVVDRSIEATHGKIVIAALNGELTVKRLSKTGGRIQLLPENPKYKPIDITEEYDVVIWGVVKHIMKDV